MNQELEQLKQIRKSLLDPSQIASAENKVWDKAPFAQSFDQIEPSTGAQFFESLKPASYKIERTTLSNPDQEFDVVIGGLCSIFTGDFPWAKRKKDLPFIVSTIRMDQIVETVGAVKNKPTLAVIEDSLFAQMCNADVKIFQAQTREAEIRIKRWLKLTAGSADLTIVRTSDIDKIKGGLEEAVKYLANDILRIPGFAKMDSAKVLLMYTSLWPQLLKNLGYLDSEKVICIEPVPHFIADRRFPNASLQNAFEDFIEWLEDEPYGQTGSFNQNFNIAGFTPSLTGSQSKRKTRLLSYDKVPNAGYHFSGRSFYSWVEILRSSLRGLPFPLRNSSIFAQGVNWGLWNPEIRQALVELCQLEKQYYQEKKSIYWDDNSPPKTATKKLKRKFKQSTYRARHSLYIQLSTTLREVLGKI